MTSEEEFFGEPNEPSEIDRKIIEVMKYVYDIEVRIEALILVLKAFGVMDEEIYQKAIDHVQSDVPSRDNENFLDETVKRFKEKL